MTQPQRDDNAAHDAPDDVPENALDVPLQDDEQLEEVELLTDVMIAAESSSDQEALDDEDVDRILGL